MKCLRKGLFVQFPLHLHSMKHKGMTNGVNNYSNYCLLNSRNYSLVKICFSGNLTAMRQTRQGLVWTTETIYQNLDERRLFLLLRNSETKKSVKNFPLFLFCCFLRRHLPVSLCALKWRKLMWKKFAAVQQKSDVNKDQFAVKFFAQMANFLEHLLQLFC